MADRGLHARCAFAEPAIAGPALTVAPQDGLAMASIEAARGQEAQLATRIAELLGIALPPPNRVASAGGVAAIGVAPRSWLLLAERSPAPEPARDLAAELAAPLAGSAAVVDQSDGRAVLLVAGAEARAVLARLMPLDLHHRAFAPGTAALSHAGHIPALLWQLDDAPTFRLAVPRSYAGSVLEMLAVAAGASPRSARS